ncbi:TlpA family protein disulfide reductase [candidate division KSB1 bacterium]|nr:TlpA family protein disulfide reductase [candidate division KSB1 bacterium]
MKKFVLTLVLLSVSVSQMQAQEISVISGVLKGHEGKPILNKAQVHLQQTEFDPTPLQTIEVAKDGSFEIVFKEIGLLYLNFTGVNHYSRSVPLMVEKPLLAEINIRLRLYEYSNELSEVHIIGDFNEFKRGSAQTMTRQNNDLFVFETDTDSTKFAYQILGAEKTGRSVNGTQSDDFEYDNGGDYRSVVKVNGGRVRIVFDPNKLSHGRPGDETLVQFDDGNPLQSILFEGTQRRDKYTVAARIYGEAHQQDMSKFTYDWSRELSTIPQKISKEENSTIRQVLLMQYVELGSYEAQEKLDKRLIIQAFNEIPATSPLWVISPWLMAQAVEWAGEETKYETYLEQAMQKHPNRDVRTNILSMKLNLADQKGDTSKVRILYERMMSEFGDTKIAQMFKSMYDPNRAIMKGKETPRFSIVSRDQPNVTYTNESMKGKIYLIDFWAVWCQPCIAELPNLHKVYEKFNAKNFEILSLSFDLKPEDVSKFRSNKWKMPWLHAFVENGFQSDIAKAFQVMGIPKPILVDGNTNTILATDMELRGEGLEKILVMMVGKVTDSRAAEKR